MHLEFLCIGVQLKPHPLNPLLAYRIDHYVSLALTHINMDICIYIYQLSFDLDCFSTNDSWVEFADVAT